MSRYLTPEPSDPEDVNYGPETFSEKDLNKDPREHMQEEIDDFDFDVYDIDDTDYEDLFEV